MRRLPVYFLLDVSDSMVGEPIAGVQNGLQAIVTELRNDPYALETVFVSVLGFAGRAVSLAPLEEICMFNPPSLPIGSGTSLGEGLNLLMDRIDREVQKTTPEKKGDWKPIVFLFTDGAPTDNPEKAIRRWNENYRKGASLVAITFGDNADVRLLEQLTDNVLTLTDLSSDSIRNFFRWVSASLKVSSVAVAEQGQDGGKLADHCINLEKAVAKADIDENFLILPVKCCSTKALWLGKYQKNGKKGWKLLGSYPVDEKSWLKLGGSDTGAASVDIAETDSVPECPSCRKSVGLVKCRNCGKLFCWQEKSHIACPWCGLDVGEVRVVSSMDVGRSRG